MSQAAAELFRKRLPYMLRVFALPQNLWGTEHIEAWYALVATGKLLGVPVNAPPTDSAVTTAYFRCFKVLWNEKYVDLVPRIVAHLREAERIFNRSGLTFPKDVPVIIQSDRKDGKADAFYRYRGNEGWIQFPPKNQFKLSDLDTTVHEIVHFWHNEVIKGGFRNTAIITKFEEVKDEEVTGGTSTEVLSDQYSKILDEMTAFGKKHLKRGMLVQLLDRVTPLQIDKVDGKKHRVHMLGSPGSFSFLEVFNQFKLLAEHDIVSREWVAHRQRYYEIAVRLKEVGDAWRDAQAGGSATESTYKTWRSKWIVTEYARTEPAEFFAEGLAACLMHPEDADPEALEWFLAVARSGNFKPSGLLSGLFGA